MSTDGNRLGLNIVSALQAAEYINPDLSGQQLEDIREIWKIISTEITKEFKENAVIEGVALQGIPVQVSTETGSGSTQENGPLEGGID